MKNTIKVFGIIALAAIIVFTMAACSTTGTTSNEPATLTLTGLDAYNGKYIYASTPGEIYAVADLHDEYHPGGSFYRPGVIENGSVTLLVWKVTLVEDEGFFNVVKEPYTGGGAMKFSVLIWEGPEVHHYHYDVAGGNVPVRFNKGKAEGVFVLGEGWE